MTKNPHLNYSGHVWWLVATVGYSAVHQTTSETGDSLLANENSAMLTFNEVMVGMLIKSF